MKKLIVNADDFGYTSGVNKGIIQAHMNGIVTSTSLMVYGKAAAEARNLSKYSKLSLGLHFQMTSEGLKADIFKYIALPLSNVEKIKKEFNAQIEEFIKITGKRPDHLDSHHHVHMHPNIKPIFEEYSKRYKVSVRNFGEIKLIDNFFGWNHLRIQDLSKISENYLLQILSELDDGTSEIMCHPGISDNELRSLSKYADERSEELKTLTSPQILKFIKNSKIKLTSWRDVSCID